MFALARTSLRTSSLRPAVRSMSASPLRASGGSHMVDPEKASQELEEGKQQNLKGEQGTVHEHAPGWNEKIASESEAIIKSHGDNKGPEQLMKETVEKMHGAPSGATITSEQTTTKTTIKK